MACSCCSIKLYIELKQLNIIERPRNNQMGIKKYETREIAK